MRISHGKKFVFLANPRTASTTIRNVLDPHAEIKSRLVADIDSSFPFYHHISALELKDIFAARGWSWDDYRTFCVVRNPYDRMVSLYHHQQKIYAETQTLAACRQAVRHYGAVHAAKMVALYMIRPRSFDEFIERIDTEKSLTTSLQNFAFDRSGKQLVKDILMYENLHQELPAYLEGLGITIRTEDIPRLNGAKRNADASRYYTPRTIELMKNKFGYEIERFGYEPI